MELHPFFYSERGQTKNEEVDLDEIDFEELLLDDETRSPTENAESKNASQMLAPIFAIKDFFFPSAQPPPTTTNPQPRPQPNVPNAHSKPETSDFGMDAIKLQSSPSMVMDDLPGFAADTSTAATKKRKVTLANSNNYARPSPAESAAATAAAAVAAMNQEQLQSSQSTPKSPANGLSGSTLSAASLDPENIFKSPFSSNSTPEELLKALNLSFIQSSEAGGVNRRRQDTRRGSRAILEERFGEDKEMFEKTLKRRENHASVERRRRDNINDSISEFARIVPDLQDNAKLNKGLILRKAVDHLEHVLDVNAQLEEQLRGALEQWSSANKRADALAAELASTKERLQETQNTNEILVKMLKSRMPASDLSSLVDASSVHHAPNSHRVPTTINIVPASLSRVKAVNGQNNFVIPNGTPSLSFNASFSHSNFLDDYVMEGSESQHSLLPSPNGMQFKSGIMRSDPHLGFIPDINTAVYLDSNSIDQFAM